MRFVQILCYRMLRNSGSWSDQATGNTHRPIGTRIASGIAPMSTHRISRDRIEITRFQLNVIAGPDSPHRVVSTGAELTIGSDPGHPLRLTDPCVSRQHCMLRVTDEGVVCTD